MESLKEFLTPSRFSLFGYVTAVLYLLIGVIFSGIVANLRTIERGNFRCDVPDSLENKNTLPLRCFDNYEQQFNSPLPLYGFVLLSFLSSVVVCVIYSWCCVKTQVERIEKDCEEDCPRPRPRITTRRVFWSYLLQLLVRLVLGVSFALLQKVVFFPSDFSTGFLCDSSPKPEANATDFNATTSALNDASRINCHNSVGSEKTVWAKVVWGVNIVFTVILLGEMIYLAVRAWKRKEFMSDSEFCRKYFFNKMNKSLITAFTSSMKKRILASEEIVELKPLIARNPGEQPENRKLDDMYVNLIIHTGRTAHDFESSMKRREILSSEYVKPEHGSVAINKPEELFLPNEDASDPRKILIIGRPGVGKSLLCNKLMRDWAGDKMFCDVNKSFEMAFFFKFRWFNSEQTKKQCLQTSLSRAESSDGNIDKKCFQYALENPEKVLLVFDGLDEFKYHESCLEDERAECANSPADVMQTSALYVRLVQGKLLPEATVVTTCRPNVVKSLVGLKFDRTVEIMGFTSEKIHEYVVRFCKRDPDTMVDAMSDSDAMSRTIWEHIESNLNLLSLCYIPATCNMFCNILQRFIQLQPDEQGSGNVELPTTLTEVYKLFLTMFIRKHHPEYRYHVLTIDDLSSKACFEETVEKTLNRLGSLARHGTDHRRLIFIEGEVQGMEGCGLLNRMRDTEKPGSFEVEKHFCFIHLTLQEFLAARYIVKTKPEELSGFISSHAADPKWHLVIQFVAGLLREQQNSEGHEVVNSIANLLRDSLTTNRDPTMALLMMNCLYELNDDTATKTAATQLQESDTFDNTVDFRGCHITAVDCTALVYFLKHLKQLQELNLDYNPNIGDGGCKEIAKLLREGGPEQLNLRNCNITDQGVSDLCKALKHQCCKLTGLNIARNTITDEGVSDLCEALNSGFL